MTIGAWFKTITNQRPEPWKEREATDALIEQLSDRVRELMEQNEELHEALKRLAGAYMVMRVVPPEPGNSDYGAVKMAQDALKAMEAK